MPTLDYAKAFSTNATDADFPSRVATTTTPADAGVITIPTSGTFETLEFYPYGTGANNSTLDMKVIGWRKVETLWIPTELCNVACTLSAAVGVASAAVTNSERFADTITQTTANPTTVIGTTTADKPLSVFVSITGFSKIEFIVDLGTATAANALYCIY